MRRVVFVDLDDTLFQTARKNPQARTVAAVDGDNRPLSYQSDRQATFLHWLAEGATVIPVTGRSVQAFRRVILPLGRQAICSFGGVILGPDGAPDPEWHRRIMPAARTAEPILATLESEVRAIAADLAIDVRHRILHDADLPLYLSVKHNASHAEETARLAEAVRSTLPDGWTLHLNDANLALRPAFLDKAHAVAFLIERLETEQGPLLTVGVGDSFTDLGYMALCDYALTPTRAQIASLFTDWLPPEVALGGDRSKVQEDAA